ncbi:MAG: ornithine cyclodeaminase family protein, partial [Candidatus Binatia bacterium]
MAEAVAPLWISEAEVVALLDLRGAIDAVERGLVAEAQGAARSMLKTHVAWGDGDTLHAIGAVWPQAGAAGSKTWAHTPGGATPLLILFDARGGGLLAVIEAFALGQLRTAAVSGVATRHMA